MDAIRAAFTRYFNSPEVKLPEHIPAHGTLEAAGWTIKYRLDHDTGGAPFLDFYAQNRKTNARHVRITSAGELQALETYRESLSYNPGDPNGFQNAINENQKHNQHVTEVLSAKGFLD